MIGSEILAGPDLDRFRAGEEAVFRRLVEELSPRLLALVRPFAADEDDAHDLVQDTWQRVFAKRNAYSGTGTVAGWIVTVCRSVCLNAAKKRTASGSRPAFQSIGDEPVWPDEAAEGNETRRCLHLALMDLPPRERDVVWLRFLRQLSTRETAVRLGVAEGTVKATLHHALKKLQIALQVRAT